MNINSKYYAETKTEENIRFKWLYQPWHHHENQIHPADLAARA